MAFLTYDELRNLTTYISEERIIKSASESSSGKKVFLSHSSADKEHLAGVIRFFEKLTASVYVDEGDKRLPKPPSPETAQILRDTIQQCPRFVVLISENSYSSRWIPWELGLADGFKGVASVAILPISKSANEGDWAKQEYLGLYPRIIYGGLKDHVGDVWKVYDPRDKANWALAEWLHEPVK